MASRAHSDILFVYLTQATTNIQARTHLSDVNVAAQRMKSDRALSRMP